MSASAHATGVRIAAPVHSTVSVAFAVSTSTDEHQQCQYVAMCITSASRRSIQAKQHVGKDHACTPCRPELHVLARR